MQLNQITRYNFNTGWTLLLKTWPKLVLFSHFTYVWVDNKPHHSRKQVFNNICFLTLVGLVIWELKTVINLSSLVVMPITFTLEILNTNRSPVHLKKLKAWLIVLYTDNSHAAYHKWYVCFLYSTFVQACVIVCFMTVPQCLKTTNKIVSGYS